MSISSTEEIVAELRAGRMVILVDEEDRENEGDLVLAADFVTPEAINFMIKHARGLVCLTLTEERCEQLELTMMATKNGTAFGTNFTVSIEAAEGVTTGISAADRARTVAVAIDPSCGPKDIVTPGHVFPLVARAVVLRHQLEAELLDPLAGQRQADQAARVLGHEVDRLGGRPLSRDDQVAFVLAILVIDQDEHPAFAGFLDDVLGCGLHLAEGNSPGILFERTHDLCSNSR